MKKYTQEFKDQVVALVELGKPPSEVAEEMEISRDLVYAWMSQAGQRALRRRLGDLQLENDIFLKSRSDSGHQTPLQQRAMIDSIRQKTGASIRRICQVLDVPRSSYHAADKPTAARLDDAVLGDRIEDVFRERRRRYGYRRIHDELRDLGLNCCPARVRRLMKERRLRALQPRNFIPRTSDGKASSPSPNLLAAEPAPSRINQARAGDITYIPTSKGWRYLAIVIDLHSRRIIGWSLSDQMRAELVCAALTQALRSRSDYQGVIFHSDRGSQYGSRQFRDLLN